jgi:tetratricopeptide (TPR) repeat protein
MWGRILGLLAGLALCGEALALWRPDLLGAQSSPELGPFTSYRLIIAALAALVGAAVLVASLLREPAKAKARPVVLDPEPEIQPQPLSQPAEAAPIAIPTPPPTLAPEPVPLTVAPAAPEPVREPEAEAVDPFPGQPEVRELGAAAPVEPQPAPAAAPEPPPSPPAGYATVQALQPAAAGATPERGTFLTAIDAGDQMRSANRWDDALELYDGALALARRAHAAAPADPAARRDLALAITHVAEVHDRDGRLDTALPLHEESLALRRDLAAETPDDIAALRGLSIGLERLADAREARGHRSRARDLYRERLPLAEKLAAVGADPALAQDLSLTRERLKDLDEALAN